MNQSEKPKKFSKSSIILCLEEKFRQPGVVAFSLEIRAEPAEKTIIEQKL